MLSKLKKAFVLLTIFASVSIMNLGIVNAVKYNNYESEIRACGYKEGVALISNIPASIPKLLNIIYIIIQIAIPVILVILGSLDLFKSIIAQKEDEMKKAQQIFIKRLITAIIVFFIFVIVKLVVTFAGDSDNSGRIMNCADCLINNNCKKIKQ